MKLSPLEIRRHEFAVRMRGFDREEVKLFLDQVSTDWEAVLEEQRRSKSRIDELEAKLNHYQKVEEALQEALRTTRENAVKTQEAAKEKAEIILDEARVKAKEIVQKAEDDRREIEAKARKGVQEVEAEGEQLRDAAKNRLRQLELDRTGVVLEIARLTDRRDHVLARLRSFLISEMEMLAKFEEADPVGYIKFLPSPDSTIEQATTPPPLPDSDEDPGDETTTEEPETSVAPESTSESEKASSDETEDGSSDAAPDEGDEAEAVAEEDGDTVQAEQANGLDGDDRSDASPAEAHGASYRVEEIVRPKPHE